VLAFGTSALQIALRVGFVRVTAGTGGSGPGTEGGDARGNNLHVNCLSCRGVEMARLPDHRLGDLLAELARRQSGEGFRQLEAEGPGHSEPV